MELVKIDKIKPNPKNPRVIKDSKFEQLKKSIQEFPEMLEKRPLVCFTDTDGKFVVLGGNMRLKASKEVGLKELPVILADDWTEEQKAEFLIKDNVGFGEWNWDELANDWDLGLISDWGVDVFELPPEVDYSVLDDEDDEGLDDKLNEKADGIKRSLCIPFSNDTYDKAADIVKKYAKRDDIDLGSIIYEALKNIKL